MRKPRRVQTLYSFKMADGSLLPRGTFSSDAPGGIPEAVMKDAISGRTTVRVLEWETTVEKPKKKVEEVVTTVDSEEVETTEEEGTDIVTTEEKEGTPEEKEGTPEENKRRGRARR